jgi:dTDP-D-glucose 4,6-dehydratase
MAPHVRHILAVIPAFIDAAFRDRLIEVYGDGTQMRSFRHVGDVNASMPLSCSSI